jgi:hypothetical protein
VFVRKCVCVGGGCGWVVVGGWVRICGCVCGCLCVCVCKDIEYTYIVREYKIYLHCAYKAGSRASRRSQGVV